MCTSWKDAYQTYDWTVDLSEFSNAANYAGYFDRIIGPGDTIEFESAFRTAVNEDEKSTSFAVAGEVCFWKNYGSHKSRNRRTQALLDHLEPEGNWRKFAESIRAMANNPSHVAFHTLSNACGQPYGFATPLTFLAFYDPAKYPMVDQYVGDWWKAHKAEFGFGDSEDFSQRNDGVIQSNIQSLEAYFAWTRFCRDYAVRVARNCKMNWRARDVEIAVWQAQRKGLVLHKLP